MEEFDIENMSDAEFAQAMQDLGSKLNDGKPISQHEQTSAHTSDGKTPIEDMHWTADLLNITEDNRVTFGTYGGVAFVDLNGSVVATQLARMDQCFCGGDHEPELSDILGLRIMVNGQSAFVPFTVLTAIMARAQNRYNGIEDIPADQETWDL